MRRAAFGIAVIVAAAWVGSSRPGYAVQSDVDIRRSLVVTEQPILQRFPLERVLDQLVAQSRVPRLTSLQLFHQWWDTQNPGPGLDLGANCDDARDASGQPALNDFPYNCRPAPAEGSEASGDPFRNPLTNPGAYVPIGLFNRFDIAPADGRHCGEHRIVYGRRSGTTPPLPFPPGPPFDRNFIIFEAILPNPHVEQGLKGCHVIAKFWADLTHETDIVRRADALEGFYFNGIANVSPVVHVDHFGNNALGAGQIRTNQFMQTTLTPKIWSLREFKLLRTCSGGTCSALELVPVTNKDNPFGPLFNPTGAHSRTSAFQSHFVGQVGPLAAGSLTDIDIDVPDRFNSGQSQASGSTETRYLTQFGTDPSAFRSSIEAALVAQRIALSANDVVARAQALSCAGCHRHSNNAPLGGGLVWPPSLGFTHVSERETEVVDGVTRFRISNALSSVFLPKRKQVLDDFMNDKPLNVRSPRDPIGGRRVH